MHWLIPVGLSVGRFSHPFRSVHWSGQNSRVGQDGVTQPDSTRPVIVRMSPDPRPVSFWKTS